MARSQKASRTGSSRSGALVRRSLGYAAFLPLAGRAPMYARLIVALIQDRRMPKARTALLAGAAGYLVLGRDLIPDDIPVIGGLDDLVVVVLAVELFLDGVPVDLLHEKLDELGIERAAYEQDVAQIRRLTPKPVRRLIRRVPRAVEAAGQAIRSSRLGPRTRAWLNREGNPA
jgi:uncharacterized membrane protein YkvA (DUF1232 family)